MRTITVIITLFSFLSVTCNAYRILVVYPSPSYSHQIVQHAVSQELAEAGHQVTIISPISFETKNPNVTQIITESINTAWQGIDFSKGMTDIQFMDLIREFVPMLMDQILMEPAVQNVLENKEKLQYDAVIVENLGYVPSYAIAEHFNATLIGLASLEFFPEIHIAMGNPGHPLLHRPYLLRAPTPKGIINKCRAVYAYLRHNFWFYNEYIPANDWVIEKHFKNSKYDANAFLTKMDFAIEGQSPVLANTRPLLPNTIQISFLHIKPVKPLPTDLKQFLDASKRGVVYVSFGSNVKSSSLPRETLDTLVETFRDLKYDVLWKFEDDKFSNKPKNVMIKKWIPQQDLLAHENVKLFVMQGGMQSLEETIARGVPVVVIPFFSDQKTNADKVLTLRIGQTLKITDLTKTTLTNKINLVIDDPTYREKIKRLGDYIRDAPMTPVQTAVWWIEYAIRNRGADHMKYKGAEMSHFEYFLIDVILFHVFVVSLIIWFLLKCIKKYQNIDSKTNRATFEQKNK